MQVRLIGGRDVVTPADGVAPRGTVGGSDTLAGFASTDPKPPSGFTSSLNGTLRGDALAVIGAGAGTATLTVVADRYVELESSER